MDKSNETPLLGQKAQALIACNQKLQELGIHNTIKLPQICVIGDQSTGKSSLVEALSSIKVPKAKGCCTQCPLAINLSSGTHASSPWTCVVSIEEHYEFKKEFLSKGVTKANPFGPWQKKAQMTITQVKTTHDKDEVPDLIRAVQLAVLNPGTRYQDYLALSSRHTNTNQATKFSPNVIRLDISEGNWPNLSFIDLPGVIANTASVTDKYLIRLIRNLVRQYAEAERSVNMLTLPMTHDIENSQACALVQDLRAEQHTLAVFTKADLADQDQREQFLRKFMGDDDLGFQHGYHFVVMPDNMDQDAARAHESAVFSQDPWSLLNQDLQSRLGVNALRLYLRNLLFQKTAETLPENLNSIKERLSQVNAELDSLPEPPNTVLLPLKLQQSVTLFENAMRDLFSSYSANLKESVRSKWTQILLHFRNTVIRAKPTVFLMTRAEQTRFAKARVRIQNAQSIPSSQSDAIELSSGEEEARRSPTKTESGTDGAIDPVHRFRIEEIRAINEQFYQACVPGEIEPRAVEEMNRLSVQHWNKLLDKFMNEASRTLNEQINGVIHANFEHYSHLELFDVIKTRVRAYLNEIVQKEWNLAEQICALECGQPLTYDIDSLQVKETRCLDDRLAKRKEKRLELVRVEAEAGGLTKADLKKISDSLGPDPFEQELRMSAKAKAYYEVASARFVDNVSLGIFGRLLPACSGSLVEDLKAYLGLEDHTKHDQIITWMAEDPAREIRRSQLLHERNKLIEGSKYIKDVLGGANASPGKRIRRSSGSSTTSATTPSKRVRTTPRAAGDAFDTSPTPAPLTRRARRNDSEAMNEQVLITRNVTDQMYG